MHDDDSQRESCKVLLKGQISIHGDKDIEVPLGESDQLAIGDSRPTHRFNGLDFMIGKRFSDAWIDALV